MKRYLRHLVLLKVSLLSLTAAALLGQIDGVLERLSLTSAWLCLLLFCATLLVGPKQVFEGQQPPANILLRRDLGIWTALTGLLHFFLGTAFSMDAVNYMSVFVVDDVAEGWFFWGSIWGFVAGLLCLILLAISNNVALRKIGTKWWKRVQRLAYPTFIITVAHGIYFQLLEQRDAWLWTMLTITGVVVAAQIVAFARRRAR